MPKNVPLNFGGLPKNYSAYDNSKIVILPIPYDKTSTWIKGADKGPYAIIEASRNMELYDIDTDSEVYLRGIFTAQPINAINGKLLIAKTKKQVKKYLSDDKFVVSVGGEHSISLGPIIACEEYYKKISILHLDAHSDRRDIYENDIHNHACIIARAQKHAKNIISVGIRSMDITEKTSISKYAVFYAKNIIDNDDWIEKVNERLTEKVYLTIDLDVFDPSIMPSTGTPEPGGLNWYQVINLIKAVAKTKQIVGFDVVELCPNKNNKAPDFLTAKLIYTALSYIFKK